NAAPNRLPWIGRPLSSFGSARPSRSTLRPAASYRHAPRRLIHGWIGGIAVAIPALNSVSVRGQVTYSSPATRSDAHSIPTSGRNVASYSPLRSTMPGTGAYSTSHLRVRTRAGHLLRRPGARPLRDRCGPLDRAGSIARRHSVLELPVRARSARRRAAFVGSDDDEGRGRG